MRGLLRLWPLALIAPALAAPPAWSESAAGAPQLALGPQGAGVDRLQTDPQLRVLLQEGPQIEVQAWLQPLSIRDGLGRSLARLEPGQRLIAQRDASSGQGLRLQGDAGLLLTVVAPVWLEPSSPDGLLVVQQRRYRGRLQLQQQDGALQAINHVGLEAYLPSVVGSEMPASWPQPALRAQAVAARTYALRQRRPTAPFDLKATVASQVYRGLESETDSTREAVSATRAQVLTYGGGLIEAVFHSSSGGSTEASGALWGQQLPYLVAVPDFDDQSPVRTWQERFEPEQLAQLLAETGGLQSVQVLERSATGRVRQLRIEGPRGHLVLSGSQLRQRLGLRSTLFECEVLPLAQPQALTPALNGEPPQLPPLLSQQLGAALVIRGKGFGHGIGMSQWGALGLARRGADHVAILSHYYPGTQLDAYRGP